MTRAIFSPNRASLWVGVFLAVLISVSATRRLHALETDPCQAWNAQVAKLTEDERRQLSEYGAFAVPGWVLIDERIVAECRLRGVFSRYLGAVIEGSSLDHCWVSLVSENASELAGTLMQVWPTDERHFPGADGAFRSELSSILVRREFDDSAIRPVIQKIIHDDGIRGELAYVLLTREPDHGLEPLLQDYAACEPCGDVPSAIFANAILQRFGADVNRSLRGLVNREDLTQAERDVVGVLLAKLNQGETPTWEDVMDLEEP